MNTSSLLWADWLAPAAERMGWALVHFLWQGVALAMLLAVLLRLLRDRSAQSRYVSACLTLATMAVCPLATLAWLPNATPSPIARRNADAAPLAAAPSLGGEPAAVVIPPPEPLDATRLPADSNAALPRDASVSRTDVRPPPVDTHSQLDPLATDPAHASSAWGDRLRPWLPTLVVAWLFGVSYFSLRLTWSWRRVQRLRHEHTCRPSTELTALLDRLARHLAVARGIDLLESTLVEVPTVIGWLRPVILLPVSATTGLSTSQLEAILAHELAHIRRGDYLVNVAQSVIESLLFYHPVVWWVSGRIRQERENCCDDLASAMCGNPVEYAQALVRMEELRGLPSQVALTARGGDLLARVRRLIAIREPDRLSPWWVSGALSMFVASSIVAGLWFATADASVLQQVASDAMDEKPEQERDATSKDDVKPAQIAALLEETASKYKSIEYSATFQETRNANAFSGQREPLVVAGDGAFTFRTDGVRWRADERGFTTSTGQRDLIPRTSVTAYDGRIYVSQINSQLVIGENEGTDRRLHPRELFWRAARTRQWLLAALRSETAKIVRREQVDGRDCVVVSAQPGKSKPARDNKAATRDPVWNYEIAFASECGWLPLRTTISFDDKPFAVETLSELKRTKEGLWHPTLIRYESQHPEELTTRKETRITAFTTRDAFADADFEAAPAPGIDVIDHRRGVVEHADPWWSEMSEWLGQHYRWPVIDTSYLRELTSYCDSAIEGEPAPAITASRWMAGEFAGWDAPTRACTIVLFVGGDAISPTPRWLTQLKGLHERYASVGLDVLVIASADASPETVRRTIEALDIRFPVAIDAPNPTGGGHGKTHDDFRLKSYAGTVLVDRERRVRTFNQSPDDGGPEGVSRIEQLVRKELGEEVGPRIERLLREQPARRLAFDITGRPADPAALAAVLEKPDDKWLEPWGEQLYASLDQSGKDWLSQKKLTVAEMAADVRANELGMTRATAIRWEEEWERRRRAMPGKGTITGVVSVSNQGRFEYGGSPPKEGVVAGTQCQVQVFPEMHTLLSTTPAGRLVCIDYGAKLTIDSREDGTFAIADLPKGVYRLIFSVAGLARDERLVYVSADDSKSAVEVLLHQGGAMSGQVVDTAGKPIVGAKVKATRRHLDSRRPALHTTAHLPNSPQTTDADGFYTFEQLFVGGYTIEASAAGFLPHSLGPIPAGSQHSRVVLRRADEPAPEDHAQREVADPVLHFECDVRDSSSKEPIAGATVVWTFDRWEAAGRRVVVWRGEFKTDEQGRYRVELPKDQLPEPMRSALAKGDTGPTAPRWSVWIDAHHPDYLPIRESGHPFYSPREDSGIQPDHRHLKLVKGNVVTGRLLLPDGKPAANIPVMVATHRDGFGDGDGRGINSRTDEQGRYRLVTRQGWPQRLHWFPEDFASDSKAVTKEFGEQAEIRLKRGSTLRGRVVDHEGRPLAGIAVRASSGTTIPLRYAVSDQRGELAFPPLPPGEYTLFPVAYYLDHRDGAIHRRELPVPFNAVQATLKKEAPESFVEIRAPEAVKLRIRMIDGRGRPLSDHRLFAGYLPDAIFSKPLPGQPGLHEIVLPKSGAYRLLTAEHSWEEAALYQRRPGDPKFPGPGMTLESLDRDQEEMVVQVVPAGSIHYSLRTAGGEPLPKDLSTSHRYEREETFRKNGMRTSGFVTSSAPGNPPKHTVLGIAPGEPVRLAWSAPGYVTEERLVTVHSAQVTTLDVVLKKQEVEQKAESNSQAASTNSDADVLIEASIVDEETQLPIGEFRALPGTPYQSVTAANDPSPAVWQAHLIKTGREGRFTWPKERTYEKFRLRFEADGFIPAQTEWITKAEGARKIQVKLRRDPRVTGQVLQPDGRPASGAALAIALPNRGVRLRDGRFVEREKAQSESLADQWRRPVVVRADDSGRYSLPTERDSAMIYVAHESGVAELTPAALGQSTEIRLRAWGSLSGRVIWRDKPGVDEKLSVIGSREVNGYPEACSLLVETKSDERGEFLIKRLPPWTVQVSRLHGNESDRIQYVFPYQHVTIREGKATPFVLGGTGRTVTGKVVEIDDFEGVTVSLTPRAPRPGDEELWKGYQSMRASSIGPLYFRESIPVAKDGTFRIEGVLPSDYQLFVTRRQPVVQAYRVLHVDPAPDDAPEQPIELGDIKVVTGER
ncbi:MAG: carboxypeptidase regulatory-like domain-containing protein [Pirellulales bacterium]